VNDSRPDSLDQGHAMNCSSRRSTASGGAGTGWTWLATQTRAATKPTSITAMPGAIATTSSSRSNDDKPYDQFLHEQLAGDELGPITSISDPKRVYIVSTTSDGI